MMTACSFVLLSAVLYGAAEEVPVPAPPTPGALQIPEPKALSEQAMNQPIPAEAQSRWYGWQLLMSDVAFTALAGASYSPTPVKIAGVAGLTLAAPALHFANGNRLKAGISVGVRASVFALAAALYPWGPRCNSALCDGVNDGPEVILPTLIALSAGLVFMLVDDIVLARISEPAGHVGRSAIAHRSAAGPTIAPILAPTHGGAAMALAGRF